LQISALAEGASHSEAMYANKNDGKPWSERDLDDLKVTIDSGLSLAQTATALSREGTIEDVIRTAEAHGWKFTSLDGFASLDYQK
jgi:hypothetical protein